MKKCRNCNKYKLFGQFTGENKTCDKCLEKLRRQRREWYERHPGYAAAKAKDYRDRNGFDYRKRSRARHATPESKIKYKVRDMVRVAILKGELHPHPCQACGIDDGKIQAHHEDYSKPLDIIWLCIRCHQRRHAELRAREG